jgi:threonine synthase
MVCMSTALPVKFENSIREAIGFIPAREEWFNDLENNVDKNSFILIDNDSDELKDILRKK